MSSHLILKHLISLVVSLAQLVSQGGTLPAELVFFIVTITEKLEFTDHWQVCTKSVYEPSTQ